jgi:hypothetical protein
MSENPMCDVADPFVLCAVAELVANDASKLAKLTELVKRFVVKNYNYVGGQRDCMRDLALAIANPLRTENQIKALVVPAYAFLEEIGAVPRESNCNELTPLDYANRLWEDGMNPRKEWLLVVLMKAAGV